MTIEHPIDVIRTRTRIGDAALSSGGGMGENQFLRRISEGKNSLKSEFVATDEQARTLQNRLDVFRRWLKNNGRSGIEHPDFDELIGEDIATKQELEFVTWLNAADFSLWTSDFVGEDLEIILHPAFFFDFEDREKGATVYFSLGKSGNFNLTLQLLDDNNVPSEAFEGIGEDNDWYVKRYTSGVKDFTEMTDEEFNVVNYYLDRISAALSIEPTPISAN